MFVVFCSGSSFNSQFGIVVRVLLMFVHISLFLGCAGFFFHHRPVVRVWVRGFVCSRILVRF